jgi:hypothetical protein
MIKLLSGLSFFFGFIFNSKNATVENLSPYTKVADSLFKYVNKAPLHTGILYDRVAPFARLDVFESSKDTTSFQHLRQAYSELYMSHYNPIGKLLSPDDWDEMAEWRSYKKTVPLGIMDMQYQQVDEEALKKKQLIMRKGRLYNNPTQNASPFITKRLQIATLLADKLKPGDNTIGWFPEMLLANTGIKVDSVSLDFGNELGSYTLTANKSATVNFKEDELVNLNATVHLHDGNTFSSNSIVEIEKAFSMRSEFTPSLSATACRRDTVVADSAFEGYDELMPLKGQAELNYYYRVGADDATNCVKRLAKPVIVLDGFDPTDKRDADFIYGYNFKYTTKEGKPSNFADELRMKGYDVIIINMPRYQIGTRNIELPNGDSVQIGTLMQAGGDFIERNAMVLVKVLTNIREELAAQGSDEKVVIVGPSMGGVISRYALSYMEKKGLDHNCRLWVSWDATHLGSVFPIGEQYFIKSMANMGLKGAKDGIKQQVNTTASKQELNHHHLAEAIEPEGAPGFKDRFYSSMENIGFPEKCRKIAMISGAINGALQPQGEAGGTAFDFKLKMNKKPRLLLFNVLALAANPDFIKAKISFTPALKDGNKPSEVFSMKMLGIPMGKQKAMPFQFSNNSVELIPGGWYPGFKEIRDSTRTKMKGFFNWLVDPQFVNVTENHCHQPSANTLALGLGPHPNPNRKWDDDLSKINFNCGEEKETPWDAWYAPETNLRHDSLTYEYAWRMMAEISGVHMPQPKIVRQLTIVGDTSLMAPGATRRFAVVNKDKTVRYNWKTSDSRLAIIAGQGTDTVTVQYNGNITGYCTIECSGEGNCYNYTANSVTLQKFGNAVMGVFTKNTTQSQTGALAVNLPEVKTALTTYQMVDAQGRVVATQNASLQNKATFSDVAVQTPGVYTIRSLQGNNVVEEKKMILK